MYVHADLAILIPESSIIVINFETLLGFKAGGGSPLPSSGELVSPASTIMRMTIMRMNIKILESKNIYYLVNVDVGLSHLGGLVTLGQIH